MVQERQKEVTNTSFKNMVWDISSPDSQLRKGLAGELGVSPVVAQLLINRGITSRDAAAVFLKPELRDMHDPFLLRGMEEGVGRIKEAIKARERVLVYGDYDVDGLTATALLTLVLREMGGDVHSYIPHRVREGYGLNEEAIRAAHRDGISLIITVDCGTNSLQEVIAASRAGIDTIITDHHEVDHVVLPPAVAVINSHQPDCTYPCRDLSGVGIAFKLAQALRGLENVEEHLDLVALGTVADVIPLKGENRILVKHGLRKLAGTGKPGLRALMEVAGIKDGKVTTERVAFMLAPRLNAPGRLDSAEMSLRLLLAESEEDALSLACELEKNNRRRQVVQRRILKDAHRKVEEELEELPSVIVLADESWHPGLVGIVAGRLAEDYCRPAILIAMDKDKGKGSARSIEQFHILCALRECRQLLRSFGGHSQAAGLVIDRKNFASFRERMEEIGKTRLAGMELLPRLRVDMELSLSEITAGLIEEISCLEPCGSGNAEPRFLSRDVRVMCPRVVKDKHLKMVVSENGKGVPAIGFGMGKYMDRLDKGGKVDIVYSPQINRWNGLEEVQLRLEDIKRL
jgi:single-stranded-DNA-specific exonuclease